MQEVGLEVGIEVLVQEKYFSDDGNLMSNGLQEKPRGTVKLSLQLLFGNNFTVSC